MVCPFGEWSLVTRLHEPYLSLVLAQPNNINNNHNYFIYLNVFVGNS